MPPKRPLPIKHLAAAAAVGLIACAAALPLRDPSPKLPPSAPVSAAPPHEDGPPPIPKPCSLHFTDGEGVNALERVVRDAVLRARFEDALDIGPIEGGCGQTDDPDAGACSASPLPHRPSVDVAVIAFHPGCPTTYANVMMGRHFEGVRVIRRDPSTLAARGVRHRAWDQKRWDKKGGAEPPSAAREDPILRTPKDPTAVDFVVPYPASSFKVMVAVKALQLVDRSALELDDPIGIGEQTRPLRAWMEDMITWSDDTSTQAIVKKLHDLGAMDTFNETFEDLGLSTLQINGTDKKTGRGWHPGKIHMTAWDTARLLWLLEERPPSGAMVRETPLWNAPSGKRVNVGFLSQESKTMLLDWLAAQAYHDVLSATSLCGVPAAPRGIPALLPSRWLGPSGGMRIDPARIPAITTCNEQARVTFAHKTGLTLNFGSDVGIVRGIPGRAERHYIITFFSNLGYRAVDEPSVPRPSPCQAQGICYTRRIAAMAAQIDGAIAEAVEPTRAR